MNDGEKKVISIVAKHFKIQEERVTLKTSFIDDLGADSLDGVEITLDLESEFDIDISDEFVTKLKTVGDIVEYIKDQKEGEYV